MTRIARVCGVGLALMLLVGGSGWAAEERPMDNAEVIKLVELDLGDEVVIAKIRTAAAVAFDLETDDLAALKKAGVSSAVIKEMIDRSSVEPAAAPAAAAESPVVLKSQEGETTLKPIDGSVEQIVAPFVGLRRFVVFQELAAEVRTRDRQPTIVLRSDGDPRRIWWLVKLDQDDDEEDMDRSIDVQSPSVWGDVLSSAPDSDSMVAYDAAETEPGTWTITPRRRLKPGEYGMYVSKGEQEATLYDFGVDK